MARWGFSKGLIAGGDHRLIVLAEISYAMTWGWVDPAAVGASLVARPEHSSVFLTGRNIADEVLTTDCSRDFQ